MLRQSQCFYETKTLDMPSDNAGATKKRSIDRLSSLSNGVQKLEEQTAGLEQSTSWFPQRYAKLSVLVLENGRKR
ncbi:hypothetical protein IFM47457_01510 [Aspergillus lentulus]|nr:hypothetical protein IFM47457_01510 [Aspergillus lentulus]